MISIFAYASYRKFLTDYLQEQRSFSAAFTQERLAKKLNVSPSALKMILRGARNLTVHNIHSFAAGMGLNPREHEFFEALVLHEQAEGAAEKRFYRKRIATTDARGAKATRLNLQDLLKEWYIPAILIHLIDSKAPFRAALVAARLGVPEARVQESFETLKKLGVLEEHKGEKIHFVMDKFSPHFSKQIYMKKLIPVLQARIESEFHSASSYFETHAVSLSEAQFRGFLEDYKALLERTMALETGESSAVYQLFTAAFPVL